MTSYPHTSQTDRDRMEDMQLAEVDNRVGTGAQAEHIKELVALSGDKPDPKVAQVIGQLEQGLLSGPLSAEHIDRITELLRQAARNEG